MYAWKDCKVLFPLLHTSQRKIYHQGANCWLHSGSEECQNHQKIRTYDAVLKPTCKLAANYSHLCSHSQHHPCMLPQVAVVPTDNLTALHNFNTGFRMAPDSSTFHFKVAYLCKQLSTKILTFTLTPSLRKFLCMKLPAFKNKCGQWL